MEHKRGDSFDYVTVIPDNFGDGHFVGWRVASQVRNAKTGGLVATLTTQWGDATTRTLRLFAINTRDWPLGQVELDVQFTRESDGYTFSTDTVSFTVIRDVTSP